MQWSFQPHTSIDNGSDSTFECEWCRWLNFLTCFLNFNNYEVLYEVDQKLCYKRCQRLMDLTLLCIQLAWQLGIQANERTIRHLTLDLTWTRRSSCHFECFKYWKISFRSKRTQNLFKHFPFHWINFLACIPLFIELSTCYHWIWATNMGSEQER